MKNRLLIIICIVLFFSILLMLLTYTQFEANQENNLKWSVGEYDGSATERTLMISEQCLEKERNPFKDYVFAKTSNGHYYIDNVICERINVQQGGCLEPFSKGYPDETCKNRVTFDYPYGETGPEINKEFCNIIKSEHPILYDTVETHSLYREYLHMCTIRGLIDSELVLFQEEGDFDIILGSCACQNDPEIGCFAFGAKWRNATHYIDNDICKWQKESILIDILDRCEQVKQTGSFGGFAYGSSWQNDTHAIDNSSCKWEIRK